MDPTSAATNPAQCASLIDALRVRLAAFRLGNGDFSLSSHANASAWSIWEVPGLSGHDTRRTHQSAYPANTQTPWPLLDTERWE
ncbi:hypothetical protein [Montanilutibacter psychrotolerans]|uniref:hypothetical protein n=1 Tax=Montanilutibacter psychrotolerans TaxID=1327343 RepID=UPI0011CD9E97|nr:hypothetical protein [Lysobacter psychrotolerans]